MANEEYWKKHNEQKRLKLIAQFDTDATVKEGIVRWNSNNQVPPDEVLQTWESAGKAFDITKSLAARDDDLNDFLETYRIAQANRSPEQIAEERAMARAAFGPGEKVVNALTGEEYVTDGPDFNGLF